MALISKRLKFVFYAIPKNGSLAVQRVLQKNYPVIFAAQGGRHPLHDVRIPDACEDYFSFAVIRNPYERLVSMWNYLRSERSSRSWWGQQAFRGVVLHMSFPTFLKNLDEGMFKFFLRDECVSQLKFLEGRRVDKFLHLENLTHEFRELPFANSKVEVPPVHEGEYDRPWSEYYEREDVIERANRMLKQDLEIFTEYGIWETSLA